MLLLLFFIRRGGATLLSLSLCCLFVAAAFLNCDTRIQMPQETANTYMEKEAHAELTVLDVRYQYNFAASYLVRVERIGENETSCNALLTYEYDPNLRKGDRLFGTVRVRSITTHSDRPASYLADGITLSLEPTNEPLRLAGKVEQNGILSRLAEWNGALSGILTHGVGGVAGDLISSLLLGNQELLSDAVMRDFRRAGILHVLSISGMHLALMITLGEFLMKKLRIRKGVRVVLILFVALFYLALTGFALSTVRSFIMTAFVYAAYLFRSDNDPLTSLFFALFLILCLWPSAVFDAGMWLSFAATLGILVAVEFMRPITTVLHERIRSKRLFRIANALLSSVAVSFAASLFIFLPAWIFFDEISLLSIPATLVLSPFATVILYLAPFYLLFSWIPPIAALLALALRALCYLLLLGTSLFSLLPGAVVSLHHPFESILIPVASAVIALLLLLPLRRKWLVPASSMAAVLAFAVCLGVCHIQARSTLSAEYVKDGSSEMLVVTSGHDTVICDISSGAYGSAYAAASCARACYATEIDAYVLTHYHTLHISTVRRLSGQMLVRSLYLPIPQNKTEYYLMLSILEIAQRSGISVIMYDRGVKLPLDTALSLVISEEIYLDRSTHPTFYVAVAAEDRLLLYLSGASHEAGRLETQIASLLPSADAVILGAHGPVIKNDIPYDLARVPFVGIADTDILLYLAPNDLPAGDWTIESDRITVPLK